MANSFLVTEPPDGWRPVPVSERRTRLGFARCVREPVDVHDPGAKQVVLDLNRPNTHSPASPYAAFPAAEAARLAAKPEVHHVPEHGSWLNMAEPELAVCRRRCLDRRLPTRDATTEKVAAWAQLRNAAGAAIDRRFTTADARVKLRRLCSAFDACTQNTRLCMLHSLR